MQILWITGTLAAGKGTTVEYLTSQKGYTHYSVREFLKKEIRKRNLILDRDTLREVANELRANYGPAYIVEQLYLQAKQAGGKAIIESIRARGEIEALQQYPDFFLLAIDAEPALRYTRAVERGSETDHISREAFQRQEAAELDNNDPHKQNLVDCMQKADLLLLNNGTKEDLYAQLTQHFS